MFGIGVESLTQALGASRKSYADWISTLHTALPKTLWFCQMKRAWPVGQAQSFLTHGT